ncbi:CYTH domain-containing protein [Elioraea rosea]|uniref:CYTH domain-containing protein n=1 Tax=Elioraea rosea TaxID=2492390 RepID=UPI001183DDB1|nr:CYTH domain-containing protein [Elioraea rosea]
MTGEGIEHEFKAMLAGPAERDRVLAALSGPRRVVRQRNVIFDTARGDLSAARLSLRLRHEDDAWRMTAKGEAPQGAPSLLAARAEAERPVPPSLADRLAAGAADPIACLRGAAPAPMAQALADAIEAAAGGAPIEAIGEFRNERTLCTATLPDGMEATVALDRSEMPDGSIHHELELEVPHSALTPASAFLDALMRRAGVPLRPCPSKRQRFGEALARRDAARSEA